MNIIRFLTISLLTLLLFSNVVLAMATIEKDSPKNNSKAEYNALVKSAKIKIELFKWQLAHHQDLNNLEKQLESLQRKRLEIQKAVKRLQFISKQRERQKENLNLDAASSQKTIKKEER